MKKTPRQWFEKANKSMKPYYAFITMVAFLVTLFIASYRSIVKKPHLSVTITKEVINYPSTINDDYSKVYDHIVKLLNDSLILQSATNVFDFLIKTKDFWLIKLENRTNKPLNHLNLRITNVFSLTQFAVSSDFLLDSEKQSIVDCVVFQQSSGIINLIDFVDIPPNNKIWIFIWGEFDPMQLHENVISTYDGGSGSITQSREVSGFSAFLVDNFFGVLTFIVLLFFFVYRAAVSRNSNKNANNKEIIS